MAHERHESDCKQTDFIEASKAQQKWRENRRGKRKECQKKRNCSKQKQFTFLFPVKEVTGKTS